MNGTSSRMTFLELYQSQKTQGAKRETARTLLKQTHWFTVNAEFDPKTGESLPQALSAFLVKVARSTTDGVLRDRLWRITEHSRASVERLFRALHASPRREHALLPVRSVRELDANSFIKLSNRPGRNIREKLAGKPYLQAVRRFQSVDLPENRLLKAFATRLAEQLELRVDCLREQEDALLPKIQSWLLSEEAQAIARWDNLPPNNTLLSHRDYRRVWDAWRWLQTIDDDIARDFSQLEAREETMRLWNKYGRMWADGGHRFAEMPILFDYEKFEVRPWLSPLPREEPRKITRNLSANETLELVCVDLTVLRPRFATATQCSQALPDAYLWQHWKNDDESVDIELFSSDAAHLHLDATSISSSDIFFSENNNPDHLDRAARAFAANLRGTFKNDTLIWLVPDFLNDFELEIIRRNFNARFPDAEPLPRSVAAVFQQVDHSNISRDGFRVVVVDTIGGQTCVTKLIARRDPELEKRLPKTGGFYWERCPPVIIASKDSKSAEKKGYDLVTVDDKGQWHDATRPAKPQFIDSSSLKSDSRIGHFEICINLTESPVVGGIRLHDLQLRARDIPLWRDRIPELSIRVMQNGHYQRFHLVSRGTTVKPIRGLSIPIPVDEDFTLPVGKPFYQLPLFQGENADELGFSALLDSPAFPLKENARCKLNLTFEYGADEPYKLVFSPVDNSFPPVRATWRRTVADIVTNAPAPEYPTPMSWADLRREPKPHSSETSDLLDWVLNAIERLDEDLFIRPKPSKTRTTGEIISCWREDKDGAYYTFVQIDAADENVFIHESEFVSGISYADFEEGDGVSFELQKSGGRYKGWKVAGVDYKEAPQSTRLKEFNEVTTQSVVESIRRRLYHPIIQVWREGRSISGPGCPSEFTDAMWVKIKYLASLLQHDEVPRPIQLEVVFLLACMHKDSPDECVQWIREQVESDTIRNVIAVGFALGDVSEQWQEHALSNLVTDPKIDSLRVFSYAIWREQHFVEKFNSTELKSILNGLTGMLGKIRKCPPWKHEHDKWTVRNWVRATVEPLELLLGLLRTRASSDHEIKMLLQPHQKITKELAKQVERVTEIVTQSNVTLFSRVKINLPQRPEGDRTPDLLYALRLYLTGDDGAHAIHVASISDTDD